MPWGRREIANEPVLEQRVSWDASSLLLDPNEAPRWRLGGGFAPWYLFLRARLHAVTAGASGDSAIIALLVSCSGCNCKGAFAMLETSKPIAADAVVAADYLSSGRKSAFGRGRWCAAAVPQMQPRFRCFVCQALNGSAVGIDTDFRFEVMLMSRDAIQDLRLGLIPIFGLR